MTLSTEKKYVNDTYAYIKPNKITQLLNILNFSHPKLQFTYESEENNNISFLEILVKKRSNNKFGKCIQKVNKH